MKILKNAIDSITMGLEDFESPEERRSISATRNIYAGILLLFKYKLSLLSPEGSEEVLIKRDIRPHTNDAGRIYWIGKGKNTVDVYNIEKRFSSLKIKVDWKRLRNIQDYRNDIEHYHSNFDQKRIQETISNSFFSVHDKNLILQSMIC